jgi:2-dehydro-3-deoxygluconokinase
MSRVVTFGEIMARLAAPGHLRFQQAMPGSLEVTFTGAEANVAMSIAQFGGEAAFVTALPDHPLAEACVATLRGVAVETRHIVRTAVGRLGLFFLENGANQRAGQVIYDRDGSAVAITGAGAYDWEGIFSGAEWLVLSGITPAISPTAAEVTCVAMDEAAKRGVKIAFDMNYRSKLWQWEPTLTPRELATQTLRELLPLADLIIGGRDDFLAVLEDEVVPATALELMGQMARQFPKAQLVAMTQRGVVAAHHHQWSGLLYEVADRTLHQAPREGGHYEISQIVDRLGGGDAFTAGLIFALMTPALSDPAAALAFATAASCLAHSIQGDFNFVTRAEVEALMFGDASGRVRR